MASLITFLNTSFPQTVLHLLVIDLLPSLTTNLLTIFLPLHIPSSITELQSFETLLDSVTQFDTHLVNLGWASETPLSLWVSQAPRVWFSNRQATFLAETREYVVRQNKQSNNVVISSGIDIMSEPKLAQTIPEMVKTEEPKTVSAGPEKNVEEEEEADGWGFDTEDVETEETSEDVEADNWKWDDEIPEDPAVTENDNSESFPYALSSIPEGLLEIIQRILDEGVQLQTSEYECLVHGLTLGTQGIQRRDVRQIILRLYPLYSLFGVQLANYTGQL